MKYRSKIAICLLSLLYCFNYSLKSQVIAYKFPEEAPRAVDFKVWANEEEILVYDTPVAGIASFGSGETANIKIWIQYPFSEIDIRPKRLEIIPNIDGQYISFTMPKNEKISVEIDKHIYRPLFIFSNKPSENIEIAKTDIVFKAGKVYNTGIIKVKSGQTILIEGGAIVKGFFLLEDTRNVKICGYGIIDNRDINQDDGFYGIAAINSVNFSIDNINIIGNPRWSTSYFACKDFSIDDIRIIGWRPADDGIDIVGCENVVISNSFIRSKDDCIAIKASSFNKYNFEKEINFKNDNSISCRNVKNIRIEKNTLWNADWGNAIEIGFETRADLMSDISVEDCDIIHVEANGGALSIHNGDRALIKDIVYRNIRIEEAQGFLCHFQILSSHYSKDKERGKCENITLENISVSGGPSLNSLITGYDELHKYDGVFFKNLTIHGNKINSSFEANIFSEFSENITFE